MKGELVVDVVILITAVVISMYFAGQTIHKSCGSKGYIRMPFSQDVIICKVSEMKVVKGELLK